MREEWEQYFVETRINRRQLFVKEVVVGENYKRYVLIVSVF
jgi:hypothetical protein